MRCGSLLVLLALSPFVSSCGGIDFSSKDGEAFMKIGKSPDDGNYECALNKAGVDSDDVMSQLPFRGGYFITYRRTDDRVRFRYASPCGRDEGWEPFGGTSEEGAKLGFTYRYNWGK